MGDGPANDVENTTRKLRGSMGRARDDCAFSGRVE